MDTVKDNLSIVHLDLSSNDLSHKSGEIVFRVLEDQCSIISLDISSKQGINRNRLTDVGIQNLDRVLQKNKYLEILNLGGNSIKEKGLEIIIKGLESNTTLLTLNIGNNDLESKSLELFSKNQANFYRNPRFKNEIGRP